MCVLKIFKTIALVLITYHFFNDSIFNFFSVLDYIVILIPI